MRERLEINKESILTGIYQGKEVLFFVVGVLTLMALPFFKKETPGTLYQLVLIGAVLTLEGASAMIEMTFDFWITKGIPWIENHKRKKALRRRRG
jgi:hypothetical protein